MLELAKTLAASTGFSIDPPEDLVPSRDASKKQKRLSSAKQAPQTSDAAQTAASLLQQGVEPPVLPLGTYSATPAALSSGNHNYAAETYALQVALAAKEQAVMECEALIDAAVEELQVMGEAADGFWESVRALQNGQASGAQAGNSKRGSGSGQWAILPKPDFGGVMREGELARDVVIPYALDEGMLGARSSFMFCVWVCKVLLSVGK